MKTVSVLALIALAGAAQATIELRADPLSSAPSYVDRAVVYSGIPGPYAAFAPENGSLGFDDYSSTMANPVEGLTQMRFVGGVTNALETARFEFYSTAGILINSFNVTFPQGGAFIWTITLGAPIDIPQNGIMQIVATGNSTGRWFLTSTAPTVGTNSNTFGGANGGALFHAFELTTPTPGALAVLGLGGLAIGRRRR
ncbi:MAG: hypothetical protein JNK25_13390 [Phycisphaerae bacterium]|nr:hypothetical protein [Phycisphaerae bacterium]